MSKAPHENTSGHAPVLFCPDHPHYKCRRAPAGTCPFCWCMWLQRHVDGPVLLPKRTLVELLRAALLA